MAIVIRNPYLEAQIAAERDLRGHANLSDALEELAKERLVQLEVERRQSANPSSRDRVPGAASVPRGKSQSATVA